MSDKNQTIVVVGNDITLDIYLRAETGGSLVDADFTPTFDIYDPDDNLVYTGTAIRVSQGVYNAIYSVDELAQPSPTWRINWHITLNGSIVQGAEEFFIVVSSALPGFGNDIIIDVGWFNRIKSVIGYPIVDLADPTDPDSILSNYDIRVYAIEPAMREYFKKFPKRKIENYDINEQEVITIEYEDDWTFGATDVRIIHDNSGVVNNSGNSFGFWEKVVFQQGGVGSYSNYGIRRYNPNNLKQSIIKEWSAKRAHMKSMKTEMIEIDHDNRLIIAHTSMSGKIQVDWAKFSNNFSDVKYQQIENVIRLAQANLLYHLADFASLLSDPTVEVSLDPDSMKARADTLMDKVKEEWDGIEDVILTKL